MVSIIIPVYNRKLLVCEMIQSIISQTYSLWELILVDDGSTDGIFELMHEYSLNDNRIHVMERKRLPKGGQTCRNIGLEKSKGEYVVFFDSDDIISANCLEKRVNFMDFKKNIDFGIFRSRSFHNTNDIEINQFSKFDYTCGANDKLKEPIRNLLKGEFPFLVCTNIYKKSSLYINGLTWDEKISVLQDLDFNLSTLFKGLKYSFSTTSNYDYFIRISHDQNSVSANLKNENKYISTKYFIDKTINKIENLANSKKYKQDFWGFILFYFYHIIDDKNTAYDYMTFCRKYWTYFKVVKLRYIVIISYFINFYKYKYVIYRGFLYLFFPCYQVERKLIFYIRNKNK